MDHGEAVPDGGSLGVERNTNRVEDALAIHTRYLILARYFWRVDALAPQ